MQRVIVRATVALCALSVGITCSLLVDEYRRQTLPLSDIPAEKLKMVPYFTEGWRRVDINRTLSFYLPQTMATDLPRDHWGSPEGSFSDSALGVKYSYSASLSCAPNFIITRLGEYHRTGVTVAGKLAKLETEQFPPAGSYSMTLCFPDIGDHKTLQLVATASDAHSLDVARKIFDSIEFR